MEGKSLNYTFLIEQDEDGIYCKKFLTYRVAILREKQLKGLWSI
ncbi:hypothetical protein [Methanosarcina vacuolata]|nr:hypothetical protein [Methanosarcina vacuolata]